MWPHLLFACPGVHHSPCRENDTSWQCTLTLRTRTVANTAAPKRPSHLNRRGREKKGGVLRQSYLSQGRPRWRYGSRERKMSCLLYGYNFRPESSVVHHPLLRAPLAVLQQLSLHAESGIRRATSLRGSTFSAYRYTREDVNLQHPLNCQKGVILPTTHNSGIVQRRTATTALAAPPLGHVHHPFKGGLGAELDSLCSVDIAVRA